MFKKELLEKDVLNRIHWDEKFNPAEFTVCYVDRFSMRLTEVAFTDVQLDGDYIVVDGSAIPVHRIRQIKHKGSVVWAKRKI
ncbi:MAG: DUF504 domain-containing protein [Candidatus Altiarchaeota archaeon]|nr:DUF504 domain-containing protein [Candidatus Altiarchaeota archaeon]